MLDYNADHYCPAYGKVISADLCYDSLCCLTGEFKVSSTKELAEIEDIEAARVRCKNCPYSDLSGGMDEWILGFCIRGLIASEIDSTAPLEMQARQAFELRNQYRTQARALMRDKKARKDLELSYPNRSFEQIMEHKWAKYGLTDEQAYRDIIRSSGTTNSEFDKKAGLKWI